MTEPTNRSVLDLFRLDGRRAIVTGGGRGIGKTIAQAFGEAGAQVALVSRTIEQLEQAAAQVPNSAAVPADVMDADPVSELTHQKPPLVRGRCLG